MTATDSDDLELLERLGGSGASVHRAVVRTTGRVVVAKHAAWDLPDVVARLGREANVLARVRHPSLVQLLATVEDERGRTLLLNHAPGGSLAHRLLHHGPMSPTATADTGARLARALAVLHRAGVVHRDVHPGNVLVDAELQPVLADLDNALDHASERLPGDDDVVGEPAHVDHRLLAGAKPGPASDLHALATTLWTTATASPPPRDRPHAAVRLPTSHPRVPAPLLEVLHACVAGEAGDAATVAVHLDALAVELTTASAPPRAEALAQPHGTAVAVGSAGAAVDPEARTARARPSPTLQAGGCGDADPVTRRWGPPPRSLPTGGGQRRRRPLPLLAALVAIVALAVWRWPNAGEGAISSSSLLPEVTPPPPCTSVTADDSWDRSNGEAPTTRTTTLADLDGDGCSEALELVHGELRTPTARYGVGLPDDVLLAGDWDGDGQWTVGLYRPATGAVYLFDTEPGSEARSRPAELHPPNGTPRVVRATDGSHLVQVTEAPATPTRD